MYSLGKEQKQEQEQELRKEDTMYNPKKDIHYHVYGSDGFKTFCGLVSAEVSSTYDTGAGITCGVCLEKMAQLAAFEEAYNL